MRSEKAAPPRLLGFSGTALAVTKGVVTAISVNGDDRVPDLFMLLEGPAWVERFYSLSAQPSSSRVGARSGHDIYDTIGGYVTGNLADQPDRRRRLDRRPARGWTSPSRSRSGLLVAILDLIPLAGATIAGHPRHDRRFPRFNDIRCDRADLFHHPYQQVANHVLQPIVYGRTVKLSPLAVLIAVLIGAELAGVVGALAAIPVAGTIQVILVDWLERRRAKPGSTAEPTTV